MHLPSTMWTKYGTPWWNGNEETDLIMKTGGKFNKVSRS